MAERRSPAFQATDKLAFLLSLVPYLMDHDRVTVAEAAAHFGVSEAQIRDAVNLIGLSGVPGDTAAYLHGDLFEVDYDALDRGEIVVMNFVAIDDSPRFSAREAAALIAGLQYLSALPENADRATLAELMAKLSRGASDEPTRVAVEQSASDETVALIRSAMDERLRIDFDYVNAEGEQRRRTVEPLRVESVDATWYLRGWDTDREAPRTFRIDRMSSVARSTAPVTHRPDEVPLSDSLFQGSGDDLVVTIEVAKSALPLLADYVPEGAAATEVEGRVRTSVRVSHYSGLKRLLAGMSGVATVVEPEAARNAVAEWAAAGAAQYRD
ncbi:helix-turn-helix transcriptional regulator [Lysobacter korlensis]|uniref:Helix-turn-helix transcriptional regulator n=1 Tax=Lysobacter korlensis TaxID=553636 RepID=A0ABV6RXD3_9GAMM